MFVYGLFPLSFELKAKGMKKEATMDVVLESSDTFHILSHFPCSIVVDSSDVCATLNFTNALIFLMRSRRHNLLNALLLLGLMSFWCVAGRVTSQLRWTWNPENRKLILSFNYLSEVFDLIEIFWSFIDLVTRLKSSSLLCARAKVTRPKGAIRKFPQLRKITIKRRENAAASSFYGLSSGWLVWRTKIENYF